MGSPGAGTERSALGSAWWAPPDLGDSCGEGASRRGHAAPAALLQMVVRCVREEPAARHAWSWEFMPPPGNLPPRAISTPCLALGALAFDGVIAGALGDAVEVALGCVQRV